MSCGKRCKVTPKKDTLYTDYIQESSHPAAGFQPDHFRVLYRRREKEKEREVKEGREREAVSNPLNAYRDTYKPP